MINYIIFGVDLVKTIEPILQELLVKTSLENDTLNKLSIETIHSFKGK